MKAMNNINSIAFGIACILDGAVRVLSLGFLKTNIPISVARSAARKKIECDIKIFNNKPLKD